MGLGTYLPDEVTLVACGIPISGFAEGTFITVEYNEDAFTLANGSDGESTRTRTGNNSGTIAFVLMQSAQVNGLLAALHTIDKTTPGGDGIAPSFIKDNSGTLLNQTLVAAEKSWIRKMANVEFANEQTGREWTIESNDLLVAVGGN